MKAKRKLISAQRRANKRLLGCAADTSPLSSETSAQLTVVVAHGVTHPVPSTPLHNPQVGVRTTNSEVSSPPNRPS